MVLAAITALKKLCNHPSLLFEGGTPSSGFESCVSLFPEGALAPKGGRGMGGMADGTQRIAYFMGNAGG